MDLDIWTQLGKWCTGSYQLLLYNNRMGTDGEKFNYSMIKESLLLSLHHHHHLLFPITVITFILDPCSKDIIIQTLNCTCK